MHLMLSSQKQNKFNNKPGLGSKPTNALENIETPHFYNIVRPSSHSNNISKKHQIVTELKNWNWDKTLRNQSWDDTKKVNC